MKTSSRGYNHSYYNRLDAELTAELRQREADARVYSAAIAARRGELGVETQIIALCDWIKILVKEGHMEAARRVREKVRRLAASLDAPPVEQAVVGALERQATDHANYARVARRSVAGKH